LDLLLEFYTPLVPRLKNNLALGIDRGTVANPEKATKIFQGLLGVFWAPSWSLELSCTFHNLSLALDMPAGLLILLKCPRRIVLWISPANIGKTLHWASRIALQFVGKNLGVYHLRLG
jgi:hypothetical protein